MDLPIYICILQVFGSAVFYDSWIASAKSGGSEETIRRTWVHRVFHIAFILGIWSFFYYMIQVLQGREFHWYHFFGQIYESNWNFSYWYLYAYISFLISLPLIKRLAQNLTNKEYVYMLVLYAFFNMFLPSVQYLAFKGEHYLNGNVSVSWMSTNIVFFPLAGYFLSHRAKEFWNSKKILLVWLIDIVTILISSYLTYYRAQIMGVCNEGSSQAFHSTFVLVNCVAIFVTCQYLNNHFNILKRIEKLLISIGGCTFGIYLLHVAIKDHSGLSELLWKIFRENLHMSPMIYAFLLCGIVFICGYVITVIMKKLPLLCRLVS